ncbi:MAG: phosphopyruvate hydratase, partial [Patescibacteria group bacterium]
EDVSKAFAMGVAIQNKLRKAIAIEIDSEDIPMGDEGGFALDILSVKRPLELLTQAIEWAGYTGQVRLALDVAASSFFKDGKYFVEGKYITPDELLAIYDNLIKEFNLISIEDPFDEEGFAGFAKLLAKHTKLRVVGDDLTTTSVELLKKAIASKSINALIIKPNQIGTLSETLDTMKFARENKIDCIVSHRSGETNDDFIADLSFAFGCFGLKAGAPLKKDRAVKYQRLAEIFKIK